MPEQPLLTLLPYGIKGKIYRSPMPNSPYFDPQGVLLDAFLDTGVNTVVMLTPIAEAVRLTGTDLKTHYQQLGFDVIYAPVEDFSIPAKGEFNEPIQRTLSASRAGKTIVIHCHAGLGRSGMFAACLAKVIFDVDGKAASNWVRQYIPWAVETQEQRQFVNEFEYDLD